MKNNRLATEKYVKELINNSQLDKDEKQYWIDILPTMLDEQIRKLINIIVLDKDLKPLNEEVLVNWEEQ